MADEAEEHLSGGAQSVGVVRIGGTVRRPAHRRTEFIAALLTHLQDVGFDGAPWWLGYDERGRQMLTFVAGEVMHTPPYGMSDMQLRSAAALVRKYHDATAGSSLCDGQEVVCHGDLGPHNMVFRGQTAVAIIDWDEDVAPGRRAVDFAHAVWCCADLTDPDVPVTEQARRTALMCQVYPGMTPEIVVVELTARFRRARSQHEAAGRVRAVEIFDGLIAWMISNRGGIAPAAAIP